MNEKDIIALPPVQPETIKALIENSVNEFPGIPALSFYDGSPVTFSEMGAKIRELGRLLRENDIRKGDRVAILGENSPNWGMAYLSIVSLGAVVVPILPDFPASDVETILNHSESKILFTTKKQFDKLNYERCRMITKVILLDDFSVEGTGFDTITFSEFIKDAYKKISALIHDIGEKTGLASGEVLPEDLAAIIYTSGTTDLSKGVMLTHGNIVSNVNSMRALIKINTDDRFLSLLPLSH